MVYNYMEVLVDRFLNEVLQSDERFVDVCRCEQCLDDMKAYALNHLKPFYITGKKGEIFGQYHTLVQQNKMDIMREVVKAIDIVSTNKQHESRI